jgi:hypothetical protein
MLFFHPALKGNFLYIFNSLFSPIFCVGKDQWIDGDARAPVWKKAGVLEGFLG